MPMSHPGNRHEFVIDLLESTVPRRLLEQQYPQQDIMRKVKRKNIKTPQISMSDLSLSFKKSSAKHIQNELTYEIMLSIKALTYSRSVVVASRIDGAVNVI